MEEQQTASLSSIFKKIESEVRKNLSSGYPSDAPCTEYSGYTLASYLFKFHNEIIEALHASGIEDIDNISKMLDLVSKAKDFVDGCSSNPDSTSPYLGKQWRELVIGLYNYANEIFTELKNKTKTDKSISLASAAPHSQFHTPAQNTTPKTGKYGSDNDNSIELEPIASTAYHQFK